MKASILVTGLSGADSNLGNLLPYPVSHTGLWDDIQAIQLCVPQTVFCVMTEASTPKSM